MGKDDAVEARKWIPNTPYIINTRAPTCACIFIRLAAIKASNCIIVSLDSRRRFILVDLSAKIIKHDHVVLNAQRVEQVKHSLGHHWRAAQVVLDVLWSVVLLEVGVAHHWSNEARSVLHTMHQP